MDLKSRLTLNSYIHLLKFFKEGQDYLQTIRWMFNYKQSLLRRIKNAQSLLVTLTSVLLNYRYKIPSNQCKRIFITYTFPNTLHLHYDIPPGNIYTPTKRGSSYMRVCTVHTPSPTHY